MPRRWRATGAGLAGHVHLRVAQAREPAVGWPQLLPRRPDPATPAWPRVGWPLWGARGPTRLQSGSPSTHASTRGGHA
eukprot:12829853-Alexandrium_andersonii.AAC.1